MKKVKGLKNAHASNDKIGMGNYYGTGIKNPMGRIRDVMGESNIPKKKLNKSPKSLA